MLEFLFNNVGLPVNIAKFLRTSILRNICKRLLLTWGNCIISITWISRYVSFHLKSDIKGALSGQKQFLANESPLKMIKNPFYFISKAHFVLKIFKLLSWLFAYISKRLHWKDRVNFKFYDVTTWSTNNCYTPIAQYLEK